MKERPIIFSGDMVKAILEGRKTMARRVVTINNSFIGEGGDWGKLSFYDEKTYEHKPNYKASAWVDRGFPNENGENDYQYLHVPYDFEDRGVIFRVYCKYMPGDKLWVRETFCDYCAEGIQSVCYKACPEQQPAMDFCLAMHWRPSIFMPRWASRLLLEITGVRVERLQEINCQRHDDVMKEGWPFGYDIAGLDENPVSTFARYWDSLNAKRGYSWESNPWVWVISFERVTDGQ